MCVQNFFQARFVLRAPTVYSIIYKNNVRICFTLNTFILLIQYLTLLDVIFLKKPKYINQLFIQTVKAIYVL